MTSLVIVIFASGSSPGPPGSSKRPNASGNPAFVRSHSRFSPNYLGNWECLHDFGVALIFISRARTVLLGRGGEI